MLQSLRTARVSKLLTRIIMKKLFTTLSLVFCASVLIFAQKVPEKNLKIFKFNPFQLATSSLSFSNEYFNTERNRSNVFTLGLRYKSDDDSYYGQSFNTAGEEIQNSNIHKGLTGMYERRFYIPAFRDGKANILNNEGSQYGVYLAPGLRLDYTQNDFNFGYFDTKFDNNGQIISEDRILSSGSSSTLGVMPFINLGIQFNIFQYGYIDLNVGGGLRVNRVISDEGTARNMNGFYYNNGIIEDLVLREGVLPTGGIAIGVKL